MLHPVCPQLLAFCLRMKGHTTEILSLLAQLMTVHAKPKQVCKHCAADVRLPLAGVAEEFGIRSSPSHSLRAGIIELRTDF